MCSIGMSARISTSSSDVWMCDRHTTRARAESGERREERSERLSHCIIITSFCFVGVCEVGVCEWAEMLCAAGRLFDVRSKP